jgi:hypothetical protein
MGFAQPLAVDRLNLFTPSTFSEQVGKPNGIAELEAVYR